MYMGDSCISIYFKNFLIVTWISWNLSLNSTDIELWVCLLSLFYLKSYFRKEVNNNYYVRMSRYFPIECELFLKMHIQVPGNFGFEWGLNLVVGIYFHMIRRNSWGSIIYSINIAKKIYKRNLILYYII